MKRKLFFSFLLVGILISSIKFMPVYATTYENKCSSKDDCSSKYNTWKTELDNWIKNSDVFVYKDGKYQDISGKYQYDPNNPVSLQYLASSSYVQDYPLLKVTYEYYEQLLGYKDTGATSKEEQEAKQRAANQAAVDAETNYIQNCKDSNGGYLDTEECRVLKQQNEEKQKELEEVANAVNSADSQLSIGKIAKLLILIGALSAVSTTPNSVAALIGDNIGTQNALSAIQSTGNTLRSIIGAGSTVIHAGQTAATVGSFLGSSAVYGVGRAVGGASAKEMAESAIGGVATGAGFGAINGATGINDGASGVNVVSSRGHFNFADMMSTRDSGKQSAFNNAMASIYTKASNRTQRGVMGHKQGYQVPRSKLNLKNIRGSSNENLNNKRFDSSGMNKKDMNI